MTTTDRLKQIRAQHEGFLPSASGASRGQVNDSTTIVELLGLIDEARAVLEESADWLCPHTEAAARKKEHPELRAWCCDCHSYLRAPEDATLVERVNAFLAKLRGAGPGEQRGEGRG